MQVLQRAKERVAVLVPRRTSGRSRPGARLFRHVRIRLTLWYSTVLACALLLVSASFFLGARKFLYTPIEQSISHQAMLMAQLWQQHPDENCDPPQQALPPLPPETRRIFTSAGSFSYTVCYDAQMKILHTSQEDLPAAFVSGNPAVAQVVQGGRLQSSSVDSNEAEGRIYSYAAPVFDAQHQHLIGIVLVGRPVGEVDRTLNALLTLLIIVSVLILAGASLGGLFLASRALQPTREAFSKQQRFIADVSHELRTPLTFLCANAEILLDEREHFSADDVSLLEDIYREANHMNALATNMLALARLDAEESHQHFEHDIVNLSSLAEKIAHQGRALAAKKGVEIQVENDGPVIVVGDPTLLEQAVLVLVDNALKYNRANGKISIRTSREQGNAYLVVEDTGIGIASESLSRLGERFYRVDKARSRATGGTGLGLSIAYGIARTHKGSLCLSSEPSVGTTATLSLPALPESSSEELTKPKVQNRHDSSTPVG